MIRAKVLSVLDVAEQEGQDYVGFTKIAETTRLPLTDLFPLIKEMEALGLIEPKFPDKGLETVFLHMTDLGKAYLERKKKGS